MKCNAQRTKTHHDYQTLWQQQHQQQHQLYNGWKMNCRRRKGELWEIVLSENKQNFTIINILRWFHFYLMSQLQPVYECAFVLHIFMVNDQINKSDSTFSALFCGSFEIFVFGMAWKISIRHSPIAPMHYYKIAAYEYWHHVFNDKWTTIVVPRMALRHTWLSNKLSRQFLHFVRRIFN